MEAVQYTDLGGRDVIEYGTVPDPEIGPHDVLVDVKAGSLNHLDVWTRKGMPAPEVPHIPGSDGAGVVEAVGDHVERFAPGDRVALLAGVACGHCEGCMNGEEPLCDSYHVIGEHRTGIFADYAAIPEANLTPVPSDVDWSTAAAAPLVFQTAWRMLITRAGLTAGDTVLVHGSAGGVGHAAVQIALHAGANVIATAGTDEKLDAVADLGVEHLVNYETTSFKDAVKTVTDGRGVDIVVDHVGEATWDDSLKCLVKGGALVTCGATTGGRPVTNVNRVFWKGLSILGSTMATPGEAERVLSLVWDGAFGPIIGAELPMSETAEAHRLIEDRELIGKAVVFPDTEFR